MKKLYELDPSQEFNDGDINTTSDENVTHEGFIAGNFEAVSGVGISDIANDEEQENNLQEMLAKLNARTDEDMMNDLEKQEQERERYRLEEEERLRQAKEKFNRERYEKEQAALAKKREKEELERQEEERLRQEELERRKNNPIFKFANKFKKNKEDNEEVDDLFEEEEESASEKKKPSFFKKKPSVTTEQSDTAQEEAVIEEEFAPEPEDVERELKERRQSSASFEESIEIEEEEENVVDEIVEEFEEEEVEDKKKKLSMSSLLASIPKAERKQKPVKNKPVKEKTKNESENNEPDWKYIATHDELTGLLNTRAYNDDFIKMSQKIGVIFFDINNLKYLNDTFGHENGNKLIKEVVASIKEQFKEDSLYRIGGDEFIYLIEKPIKGQSEKIEESIVKIHNDLERKTKRDKADKMIYSVSIGYALGDGKASKEDVVKAAEASMYQNKKAYKVSHPEFDIRGQQRETEEVKKEKPTPEHDELLTKEQRQLKNKIKEEHEKVSKGSTQQIMREVQRRAGEIEAIFIASPSFDHLFVITEIDDFLDIMEQQKALIDYSYLYIVYHGGPQYYGADEYYKEVTHLFESIADAMMSGRFRSEKDIQNIPGINIFKNIYV